MKRAVIRGNVVEWSETCYCNPPLRHERATIYDHFFDHMKIERSENPVKLEGEPFWDYLHDQSDKREEIGHAAGGNISLKHVPLRIL